MAWFNPPLHKPGNKRCPKCGKTQWGRWPWNGLFSLEWQCPKCMSSLKADVGRHWLGSLCRVIVIIAFLSWSLVFTVLREGPGWLVIPALMATWAAIFLVSLWIDSYELKSTEGVFSESGNPKG